tara:strand:+ start:494 stop:655 length:162 start_codon:yes stop_codon:yes gene_type:complete
MGVPIEIGVLFAPCVFFLLKYWQILFSRDLHKTPIKIENIYLIRRELPKNDIL